MSRNTKWKLEKTKVKVVFRLQFHATHIPQSGWNNLFISLIPSESNKASAKTNKANVRNGTCKWADPIYETTRLLQDSKTKQYEEKIYKLVVATGTSRSSVLGEVNINLSDYADALKPTVVTFPLHGLDSGAILHVTVQLLTSKTGFREFEQQREVSDRGLNTNTDHDSAKLTLPGEAQVSRPDKVNPRVRFKPEPKELPSLEEESGFSEEYADSAAGFDGSSNNSGSLYAEKHDNSSSREIDSVKSSLSGNLGGVSPTQSPIIDKGQSDHHFLVHGASDWFQHWHAENSMDGEMVNACEENNRLRGALEAADLSIHELRQEIISLQNFADGVGAEAQKLTEEVSAEISFEHELAKEVSLLKSECSRFKDDLECLRNLKTNQPISTKKTAHADSLLQDLSIRWVKGLSDVEDKIGQLQEKVHLGSERKDMMFLHSDLDAILSVLQDLKQGTERCVYQLDDVIPTGKARTSINERSSAKSNSFVSDTGLGVELCHPDSVLLPGLLAPETGTIDATNAMQGEIFKLLRELDESKAERESHMRKMDQMECYYEALIQELEENQKQMHAELQNLRNEHSSCIYTISSTKAQMEAMHQQMSGEILQLAEERCSLDTLNKALERRAVTSEAALKRARLNYSIAVNQLQKDLEVLSLQVLSMYETNENLIRKALSEASEASLHGWQEAELVDHVDEVSNTNILTEFPGLGMGVKKHHLRGDSLLEDLKSSLVIQEDLYRKIQEELLEVHHANIHLDVFSLTLHETLLEAALNCRFSEDKMHVYAKQLELSSRANESLQLKLKNMTDEICIISEEKTKSVTRCNGLALENKTLEVKLKNVVDEKCTLSERVAELENLVTEYSSYNSNFEDCNSERANLANEFSSLQEELLTLKVKVSENENLQRIVSFLRERLEKLLGHGNEQVVGGLLSPGKAEDQSVSFEEFVNIFMFLEERHRNLHEKILLLMEEKKDLVSERDIAHGSLANAESELEAMKLKFQREVPDMVSKLDASSILIEKLQIDLEAVSKRVQASSEVDEKFTQMTQDLLSNFSEMEALLQEITSKNNDLAEEISALGSVTDELEWKKLIVDTIKPENLSLTSLLQNKTNESVMLMKEVENLRETVGSLQGELLLHRGRGSDLEAEIFNLNSQLKERGEKLQNVDQQEAEISYLKQQLSDAESENLNLHRRSSLLEAQLNTLLKECSSTDSEVELLDLHGLMIAADVEHIVVVNQYKLHSEELSQQLEYFHQHLQEVYKKNLDLASMFSNCLADKENYAEENARLRLDLKSVRSESESLVTSNRALEQSNTIMATELKKCRKKSDLLGARYIDAMTQKKIAIEEAKCLLESSQIEIEDLIFSNEDLEIRCLILLDKVSELTAQINCLGDCREELAKLHRQCSELTRKLSEQMLKTEEFKNLSVHLKELKDKAEAENIQAREKKDAEGSSVVMQESLRIAFIKEQYETKLQEVRQHLSISKRHSEEMLWKLQDALGEVENKKKSEVSLLQKNEELLVKITELEAELQSVLSDNREKFMAYEQLKAELDCSVMSLDCCMEEKKLLKASLQECNDEKSRLADDVELLREQLENLKALMRTPENKEDGCHIMQHSSNGIVEEFSRSISCCRREAPEVGALSNDMARDIADSANVKLGTEAWGETNLQDASGAKATNDFLHQTDVRRDFLPDAVHEDPFKDQLKPQNILSSIDRLQKELERMRNESELLPGDKSSDELDDYGLQREQVHLEKVTEELENMSSLYNDSSRTGNSVERVLALELELAEALQAKKTSSLQFQSTFLKLHSDEAAVFHSFRDINDLIKDMLEMKERHSSMEAELKEMHQRYSQLSLDFAEVEGDRQKLAMMLKNMRSPRKHLSRLPTSNNEEPSL